VLAEEEDKKVNTEPSSYCKHIVKLLSANGFNLDFLDLESLITKTPYIQAWPMVDLDPLNTWADARIGPVGDDSHGMLSVGSRGAMSTVSDALVLCEAFEKGGTDPTCYVLHKSKNATER